jgi:prepilin-type N-terminal cleavage/methylation domain-containing protein
MMKLLHSKKGLTLIELIISLALLGFVLIGFLNLFLYGVTYIAHAREKTDTSFEAQSFANRSTSSQAAPSNSGNTTIQSYPSYNLTITLKDDGVDLIAINESMMIIEITTQSDALGNQHSLITTAIPENTIE